ncbi:MAG: BlaI/MecI/CopY family transcriptional regulator [Maricaulaceae bacterium]
MSLTQPELAVLKRLWSHGPQSAREIHNAVAQSLDWSISTTRTQLERMREKALIERQSSHGLAVYAASVEKLATLSAMITDFASRVLELDHGLPASAFASSAMLDAEELETLDALLAKQTARDGDEPS